MHPSYRPVPGVFAQTSPVFGAVAISALDENISTKPTMIRSQTPTVMLS